MDKETLLRYLEPFTDDIPIKMRMQHWDRGTVIEPIVGINYGFENDNEGVVYLELQTR